MIIEKLIGKFDYIQSGYTKDGVAFQLRPATLADVEQITANIQAVCAENAYLHSSTFMLTDEWRQTMRYPADAKAGRLLLVAQLGDTVIGHLRLFPEWYGANGRHVGEIGLALVKPWRERGLGTAMLAYAQAWAEHTRFQKLTAAVIATNQRALNLFARFGFTEEGRRLQQVHLGGQYVDDVLLGRFLNGYQAP